MGSLFAVLLAVHLATALWFAALFQVGNATSANGVFALLLGGQACLLGLWAGLAWRFEARRVVTCLAGLALGSVWLWALILTTTQTWHRSRIRWFAAQICATVIVTTFLATAALSRRYFELTRHPVAPQPQPPKPFQFSLRQLMLVVVAIGVTLGVARARNELFSPTGDEHVVAVRASLFMWLYSTVAVVAIFVPKRLGIKGMGVPFLVFGLGYFLDLPTALFASGTAIVITATLFVFRLAGYRLVPKKRTDRLPSVGRDRLERRPVEDCGAKIAKWLAAQSDLESTPRTSAINPQHLA